MEVMVCKIVKIVTLSLLFQIFCAQVTAEDMSHKGVTDRGKSLVIGYTSQVFYNVDPKDAIGLTKIWAQTADRKLNSAKESTVVFFKDLLDAESALANNEVDIMVMIPEEFVHLRANIPLVPVLSADYGKHFYNELLLLVRGDHGITRIGQLRGKNLRIETGQKGSIPMQWLDSLLTARVLSDAQGFFGSITEYLKATQVIMPVFFGQADACLASRTSFEVMAEMNPQLGRQLRILERSPGFATGILAVRKDIRNPKRDAMVEVLQEMYTDPKGKQLLTLFRCNRLVPFKTEHLATVEKVLREHRSNPGNPGRRRY